MGYFGGGGGSVDPSTNNAWTGTNSFIDTKLSVLDDVDPTKVLQFQASSIAAGTTRTFTFPNATDTVCTLSTTQTYSGTKTFGANPVGATFNTNSVLGMGSSNETGMYYSNSQVPSTLWLGLGTAGNSFVIGEAGDRSFNFAHALQTNPTLFIHSANQSTTEWVSFTHNQTQGLLGSGKGPIGMVGGANVVSAATITATGNVFHVTNTTNIDNVTILAAGTVITLIFDGILTVGDGTGNLKLAGNFVTTADDTLTLASDGTNWYEVARSVN